MVEEESEIGNDESKLWVDGNDRGGLFKVNDSYHRKCGKEISSKSRR